MGGDQGDNTDPKRTGEVVGQFLYAARLACKKELFEQKTVVKKIERYKKRENILFKNRSKIGVAPP